MFYLHVEITNYRQLKIIIPEVIEPLEQKIIQIISASGGETHPSVPGLYCYPSTFRETSLSLISSAFSVYQYLQGVSDKLYGFSIILSDSQWNDEGLESILRGCIYTIPLENSLWIFDDPRHNLEQHVNFSRTKGGLLQVLDRKEEMPGTAERMKRFALRNEMIGELEESIRSVSAPFAEKSLILIKGPAFSGRDYNLDALLERLESSGSRSFLFLRGLVSENPLDPFVWSISRDVEENVARYLDNGELDTWKSMSSEMELFRNSWNAEQCSDFIEKDFFTLYSLYLKAYIRIRKENNQLPLIVCKNVDSWKPESLGMLIKLFRRFVPVEGLIPVCTAEDSHWTEELDNVKIRSYVVKPYSVEEMKSRKEEAFPDLPLEEKEVFALYKKSGGLTITAFHSLLSALEREYYTEAGHPARGIIDGFDELTVTLFYLITVSNGLIRGEDFLTFFEGRDVSPSRILERMDHLYMLSLVEGSEYPRPLFSDLELLLEARIVASRKDLINSFTNYLFSLWEKGQHLNIENLFLIILRYGQTGKSLQVYQVLIDRFLNNKQFKLADYYLSRQFYTSSELSIGEKDALMNIVFAGRMRSALLKENYRDVQSIISESEVLKVHKKSAYSSQVSLQQSIYMNSMGDYSRGLNLAKEALFEFQQAGDSAGEAKANIELATALLGQGKIRTSQDYFEISRRASFQSKDLLCQIRSSFFKALSDFIFGNIPMALRGVNDILPVAEKAGRREWQLMLVHLKGRILFDLGRYRDCEDLYKDGYETARSYGMDKAARLLRRWTARSLVYNERFRDGLEILKDMEHSDESLFFLAEAAYFGRREDKALEYIGSAGTQYRRIDFISGETPLWRDGFSSVEGYSLSRDSDTDVLLNQIQAFKFYLQALNGDYDSAEMGFSELTGRFNTQAANHYFHKYFYMYSSILPDSAGDDEKRLKILSNSVKLLQSRAGRFDDQKMKHSFLNYNLWNKKITEESVKRNFI